MKFFQLIKYKIFDVRNNFLRKLYGKWGAESSSKPLFFKKNALYKAKARKKCLSFNIFW